MKKGFTLLEMIAVILIIGMLILTVFPLMTSLIKSQSGRIDDTTKKIIYDAADLYVKERTNTYPANIGATYCSIQLKTLMEDGKLKGPIKDYKSGENLNSSMVVKTTVNSYGEYEYELVEVSECVEMKYTSEYCFQIMDNGDGTAALTGYYNNENNDSTQPVCPRDVIIPPTIEGKKLVTIGTAFYNKKITSAVVPFGVTLITAEAFSKNTLREIQLPETLKEISGYSFYDSGLVSITLPASLESIAAGCFGSNQFQNVTVLGDRSRFNAEWVDIGFPENLMPPDKDTSESCFVIRDNGDGTAALTGYYNNENNDSTQPVCPKNVVIPATIRGKKITSIVGAFINKKITSAVVPYGVTLIDSEAFSENFLSKIQLPESLEEIGGYSFYNSGLTSIILPASLKTIRSSSFGNNNFTSITVLGDRTRFNTDWTSIGFPESLMPIH